MHHEIVAIYQLNPITVWNKIILPRIGGNFKITYDIYLIKQDKLECNIHSKLY